MQSPGGDLEKRSFKKFCKPHWEITVAEYFFNNLAGLTACKFIIKENPSQILPFDFCERFQSSFL